MDNNINKKEWKINKYFDVTSKYSYDCFWQIALQNL